MGESDWTMLTVRELTRYVIFYMLSKKEKRSYTVLGMMMLFYDTKQYIKHRGNLDYVGN